MTANITTIQGNEREKALVATQQRLAKKQGYMDKLDLLMKQVNMVEGQIEVIDMELHATYVETSLALEAIAGVSAKRKTWWQRAA